MMARLVSAGLEIAAILALFRAFYRDGFTHGYKSGYECGRTDSEKWFVQQGAEVDAMRQRIWKEEERRP